ncbi:helix-turn-helix domain-containing protein [Candidatus Magnetaquiglobus chichijimensis]|uniref:helix-turn-helix domain-containing protein n=1 Tax=Candidatus Magnetaquiglobus chichijimensis TaxID=3141448 RepID=UPI003B96D0F2
MDKHDITAAVHRNGWSLRRLSEAHGFRPCSIGRALHMPYPNAEWIIADAIGMKPWEIWPERYPNGPTDRATVRRRCTKRAANGAGR